MKILVIQQKMIGDVLVSSVICNNLRKAYTEATIDYLVYESTIPVLLGNPNIDNIILFKEEHRKSKIAFFKLALELRKEKYDLLIDAYSKMESWLLIPIVKAKTSISYKKPGRNFLYTYNVPFAEFPKSNLGLAIERRISLLDPLLLSIEIDPSPKLYLSNDEIYKASILFEKDAVKKNGKTVMISLIGSEKLKTYPLNYMSKIIDQIADNYNVNLLFNYFPKQVEDARQIYNNCKTSTQEKIYFDLIGDDLRSFVGIMNQCDLIIGNDGGAINIAKALGKPSFIIFSPWIEKKIWATFEDGINHVSVHLKEFLPDVFKHKTDRIIKKETFALYKKFRPELIIPSLNIFLERHLK